MFNHIQHLKRQNSEDPPLSCPAGWSEVQRCFSALQVLHLFLLLLSLPSLTPDCPHWAVRTGCTVCLPACPGSAGLPCAFYLYFMLWPCAETAPHSQWANSQTAQRTSKEEKYKRSQTPSEHQVKSNKTMKWFKKYVFNSAWKPKERDRKQTAQKWHMQSQILKTIKI